MNLSIVGWVFHGMMVPEGDVLRHPVEAVEEHCGAPCGGVSVPSRWVMEHGNDNGRIYVYKYISNIYIYIERERDIDIQLHQMCIYIYY